ncbi:MAG: hypothetical protein AVDCRST_MAG34-1418 [uncultured Nocardioidaceae bacterium]|uniref:ATP synthase F0 subunit B n=1 Tax=uncultured Nocardioidaceae bacterium TaxID=253824 RepID=A0A6J4L0I8_9ACTN|nr:MAG: hypothetical protein AVDCRST_MAG34-1418 [uncultured Nocardioidaceae bacterium]
MTETMGSTGSTPPGGTSPGGDSNTRDVAKDEAKGVAQDAAQAGKQTAQTAKEQAGQVAGEAASQARMLLDETRSQLTSQGAAQQEHAASRLRTLADELTGMVNGQVDQPGIASELATQASERVRTLADTLENGQPSDLLNEVRRFARQRPGIFLLSAAAVGFIGGRMTRGVADEVRDQGDSGYRGDYASTGTGYSGTTGTGYAGTTGTGYSAGLATSPAVPVQGVADAPTATTGYSVPPAPAGDETAQFTPTAPATGLSETSTDQMPSEFGARGTELSGNRTEDEDRI